MKHLSIRLVLLVTIAVTMSFSAQVWAFGAGGQIGGQSKQVKKKKLPFSKADIAIIHKAKRQDLIKAFDKAGNSKGKTRIAVQKIKDFLASFKKKLCTEHKPKIHKLKAEIQKVEAQLKAHPPKVKKVFGKTVPTPQQKQLKKLKANLAAALKLQARDCK